MALSTKRKAPVSKQDNRLKKTNRLLDSADFDQVFNSKDYKTSNRYLLLLAKKNGLSEVRIGLVVSKKKIALAVNRNRFKRLAKEHLRKNKRVVSGFDIVILARADLNKLNTREQNEQFAHVFKNLIKLSGSNHASE